MTRKHELAAALACGIFTGLASAGGPPACRVEPFTQQAAADRESLLREGCSAGPVKWAVETPREHATDPGPSLLRAQVDTTLAQPLSSSLLGALKFNWSGLRNETLGELRTERSEVAAGGLMRLDDRWAVEANVGREMAGASRSRATLTSLWQPSRSSVLFAEWATAQRTTEMQRVGGRLWLMPKRLALDVGSSHLPDGIGWNDHRIGLTLNLTP